MKFESALREPLYFEPTPDSGCFSSIIDLCLSERRTSITHVEVNRPIQHKGVNIQKGEILRILDNDLPESLIGGLNIEVSSTGTCTYLPCYIEGDFVEHYATVSRYNKRNNNIENDCSVKNCKTDSNKESTITGNICNKENNSSGYSNDYDDLDLYENVRYDGRRISKQINSNKPCEICGRTNEHLYCELEPSLFQDNCRSQLLEDDDRRASESYDDSFMEDICLNETHFEGCHLQESSIIEESDNHICEKMKSLKTPCENSGSEEKDHSGEDHGLEKEEVRYVNYPPQSSP